MKKKPNGQKIYRRESLPTVDPKLVLPCDCELRQRRALTSRCVTRRGPLALSARLVTSQDPEPKTRFALPLRFCKQLLIVKFKKKSTK